MILPADRLVAVLKVFSTTETTQDDWKWLGLVLAEANRKENWQWAKLPGSEQMFRLLRGLSFAHCEKWDAAATNMALGLKASLVAGDLNQQFRWLRTPELDALEEYTVMLWMKRRVEDIGRVVRYAGPHWHKTLLLIPGTRDIHPSARRAQEIVFTALNQIRDPAKYITVQIEDREHASNSVYTLAIILLTGLVSDRLRSSDAFTFWNHIIKHRGAVKFISPFLGSKLAINLSSDKKNLAAKEVFKTLYETFPKLSHSVLSRQLQFHSMDGDQQQVQVVWAKITKSFKPTTNDRIWVASVFAATGDIDATRKALRSLFGAGYTEDVDALCILTQAFIAAREAEPAFAVIKKINTIQPRLAPHHQLLRLYAAQADAANAINVFDTIIQAGLSPTEPCYNTLLSVFANTADYAHAQEVFNAMVRAGVEPSAKAWTSLVNSYIEAGEFGGAAALSDKIPLEHYLDDGMSTAIMKAFVYVSAPLPQVVRIFRQLRYPSAQAWALMIQSAADCQDMDLARSIFEEMDARATVDCLSPKPNVYVFSILLHAYLRKHDRESSRAVYDAMIERGIVPTSVTYAIITNSYAKSKDPNSFQQAHDFATSVVSNLSPDEKTTARGKPAENVFGPLIIAAGKAGDLSRAKSYYETVRASGGTSVILTSQLMNAYRHARQPHEVYRLWLRLFKDTMRAIPRKTPSDKAFKVTRSRNNVLCVPLSIMIRTLADTGDHGRLKKVWHAVRTAGFGVDAANYNHFAAASAQTGDIEGAFHIIDRVIMPRYDEVREREYRDMRTANGLAGVNLARSSDDPELVYGPFREISPNTITHRLPEIPVDRGNTWGRFILAQRRHAMNIIRRNYYEKYPADDPQVLTNDDVADPDFRPNRRYRRRSRKVPDFEHDPDQPTAVNTEIMSHWRPTDIMWRPDERTLKVINQAFLQLQIENRRRVTERKLAVFGDSAKLLPQYGNRHAPEYRKALLEGRKAYREAEAAEPPTPVTLPYFNFNPTVVNYDGTVKLITPHAMIARIRRKYPRIVQMMMWHRRKNRLRTGRVRIRKALRKRRQLAWQKKRRWLDYQRKRRW